MLNPGSCKPILAAQSGEWTEAKPDKTQQFQLMRLMERMCWDEMKIVNLSDFCEGNRPKFLALLKRSEIGGIVHSRFANNSLPEWSNIKRK